MVAGQEASKKQEANFGLIQKLRGLMKCGEDDTKINQRHWLSTGDRPELPSRLKKSDRRPTLMRKVHVHIVMIATFKLLSGR